jgi:hypothetical protein
MLSRLKNRSSSVARFKVPRSGLTFSLDNLEKSAEFVMPDLIRHPEDIELTGFRSTPAGRFKGISDFLRNHQP